MIDVDKAIQANRRHAADQLWTGRYPQIAQVLGLTALATERAFAQAVAVWQKRKARLKEDGILGRNTWTSLEPETRFSAVASLLPPWLTQCLLPARPSADPSDPTFPPRPEFGPMTNNKERAEVFGEFKYVAKPTADNPEAIEILGDWEAKSIVSVELPQLRQVTGGKHRRMRFHRLAARELEALWADWEKAGLLDRILTYGGSFVPRFVRGSTTTLSNHAFGSAFDINVPWNPRKKIPARLGEKGCVRELVPIANEHGFYWGGHYTKRPDGMHFEVAVI